MRGPVKQKRIAEAILSVVMLSFVGKLQCLDLLFGKAGALRDHGNLYAKVLELTGNLFNPFCLAFLLGVADLIAYVSFCGHVVIVFGLLLRGKCSNICGFKQEFEDFLPQFGNSRKM